MTASFDRLDPASWRWVPLPFPKGRPRSRGTGFWGGCPVVYAEAARSGGGPYLYEGVTPRELVVVGAERASFGQGSGEHLAGTAWFKGVGHAVVLMRAGDGLISTDLHDAGYVSTSARAAAAGIVVGSGVPRGSTQPVGLAWKLDGGGPSMLNGLEPGQPVQAEATDGAMHGGVVVGRTVAGQAAVWMEGAADARILPAAGAYSWGVAAIADGASTGTVWKDLETCRPSCWPSPSGPWVDLTPEGFHGGEAHGAASGLQAGWCHTARNRQGAHAILWGGSPAAAVDLHAFVDAKPFNESYALAVRVGPDAVQVVGWAGHNEDGRLLTAQACCWTAGLKKV